MDLENNLAQKNTYFKLMLEGIVKKTIVVILGLGISVLAGLVMTDQVIAETVSEKNLSRAIIKIGTLTCGGFVSQPCSPKIDTRGQRIRKTGIPVAMFKVRVAMPEAGLSKA